MSDNRTKEPVVMALGGRHVVLSGNKRDNVYSIGFTRSPKPLLTPEEVRNYPIVPDLILEFHDQEAIKIFTELVQDMYEHSLQPTWVVVPQNVDAT
jgi:hypothetical protein